MQIDLFEKIAILTKPIPTRVAFHAHKGEKNAVSHHIAIRYSININSKHS